MTEDKLFLTYNQQMKKLRNDKHIICKYIHMLLNMYVLKLVSINFLIWMYYSIFQRMTLTTINSTDNLLLSLEAILMQT